MSRLTALSLAAALLATLAVPASAQNAGQIASVRRGASCAGCNLFQGDFSGLEARGLNLSRSRLRQADLSLSVMNRTRFSNADLRDVDAYGGVFSGSSFSGADLTNASFVGAYLQGANFAGATLQGTNISGAEPRANPLDIKRAAGTASPSLGFPSPSSPQFWPSAWV